MSTLVTTVRESIRYRGRSGHWSWVAHRLSGLAILLFLVIHVWDTANAFFLPHVYEWSLAVFKWPPVAVGEIPLMAAVLYHAFNGVRITILDFKPELWEHQQKSAMIVWGLFLIVFIPIGLYMASEMWSHCAHATACWSFPSLSDFPAK